MHVKDIYFTMKAKHNQLRTTNSRNRHGSRTMIRITMYPLSILLSVLLYFYTLCYVTGFQRIIIPLQQQFVSPTQRCNHDRILVFRRYATTSKSKGFGSNTGRNNSGNEDGSMSKKTSKNKNRLLDSLEDKPKINNNSDSNNVAKPYVKAEQDILLDELAYKSSRTIIGRVVAEYVTKYEFRDPFWELIPSLISSKFPNVKDDQLHRIAGFIRHTLSNQIIYNKSGSTKGIRPIDWIDTDDNNLYRPYDELHAYMPGLGPTQKFYDPSTIYLCKRLQDKYDIIRQEYDTLMNDSTIQNKFQSVTDMNYDSGWKTLILFYNGQRIPNFPYHKCPITTKIMESVPLAGRIAGFNRQQPMSGIPLHTDGNNMWLTCQMGIHVPEPIIQDKNDDSSNNNNYNNEQRAYIRVGNETRYWENGQCIVYDTTYQHETYNPHPIQERVVLHIDFYNTLAMTSIEIEIMQYIYSLREQFMKAEGNAKVGAKIL